MSAMLADMSTLLVILLIGAVVRVSRLITTDTVLEPFRVWIDRRLPANTAYLFRCDWCMSVWVGFAIFTLGWYAPDTPSLIVSGALSASLVAGWGADISASLEAAVFSLFKDFEDGE